MLSIQGNKNIGILMEYGNGEKDGVPKRWLLSDPAEQEEPPMDIVTDSILPLYMLILWNNTPNLKFANFHYKVLYSK
jgi:hypothetical protein